MTLFIAVFVLTVSCLCQGCENVLPKLYVNDGTDVQIKFTPLDVSTTGLVTVSMRQNSTIPIITIVYRNGRISIDDSMPDVDFNGDATHGKIWFIIYHIGHDRAGVFELIRISFGVLECQTVYILGKPTVWLSKNGEDAAIGGNAIFSCHGTSTTAPTDHGLNLIYLWTFGGVPANDSRFTLSANNMTVTSVTKFDQNKTVSCKVTENVEGGLTSDESNREIINVNFGPEDIRFEPNDTRYRIVSDNTLPDITCKADCNPLCNFTWTKDGHSVSGKTGNTLSLSKVTRMEVGKYTCTVVRGYKAVMKDLFIEVIYGPDNITVNPMTPKYSLEEHHIFNPISCSADCWENCWYQWTGPVNLSQGSVLSLDELNRNEDGVYTCTAINNETGSTAKIEISIEVTYGPEKITLNPPVTSYSSRTGTTLTDIVCNASCNPLCTYVWTKDGRSLQGQSGNTLSLGYLNRSKAGIYTCRATRSSYTLTKDVIVHVIYGPDGVLITPSENIYTYNEGHALNDILCSSECYPSCLYKWSKQSASFRTDHGTLSLGNLTRQKRGLYICHATNPSTQLQRSSQITVNVRYGPDKIILVPTTNSHTIVEGDTLQNITCLAEECWPACAQHWINVTSGKPIGSEGTLSLGASSRYFTGEYTCTSTNISPEIQRKIDKSIVVTVSYFPDVNLVNETNIEATEHNVNISLLCLANGVPDRYTFFPWVQKAPDLKTSVKEYKGVSLDNQNRLVLQHLSYMNSGLYICSVTNNITNYKTGESIATETVRVKVKSKPFVTESEPIVDGATGKHVKLSVSFFSNGETDPSVTWFKIVNDTRSKLNISSDGNFREMSSDETVIVRYADIFVHQAGKKTQLEISNITEDDFGYYEIEIVNSIGGLYYRLELVPRGPPSLPVNFTVVNSSETTTSITLFWFPGFHGGANQTFHIEYKTNSTQWAKGPIIPGGKRSDLVNATVSDLQPGTEYMFQLYSENIHGRKNVSIFIAGTTSEIKSDAEPISASSLNVGATVGAAITAVLIVIVITVTVIFLLRRYKRLRVSRNEQKRDVVVGFINGHEYVNMNAPTGNKVCKAGSEGRGENMRLPEQPYESLNPGRKSSSTYEKLTTAKQSDTQRMNDNKRRMRPKDEQNLGQKVADPEIVYSNLMIRNA